MLASVSTATATAADVEKQQQQPTEPKPKPKEPGPVEFSEWFIAALSLLSCVGCLLGIFIISTARLGDCPSGTRWNHYHDYCEPTMQCTPPTYRWIRAHRDPVASDQARQKAWSFFFAGIGMALIGLIWAVINTVRPYRYTRSLALPFLALPFLAAAAAFANVAQEMLSNGRKVACSGDMPYLFEEGFCADKPVDLTAYDFKAGCMPLATIVGESRDMQNCLVALSMSATVLMCALAVLSGIKDRALPHS